MGRPQPARLAIAGQPKRCICLHPGLLSGGSNQAAEGGAAREESGVMVMSKSSNNITATLARQHELRAIAQQQDPRLAASEALGFLQRHRKVLGLPKVLEQPLHYVVAAFAEVERGNRAALFEPVKKGRPPDPAAKRDIRVKVALAIDLLEAADRTREQAARQVAHELQLRGIAIRCRSSKGDVPEWRKVLEWRNELRRASQGWSPSDIYCFQRYRYLKIVRTGKLKPEAEAKRLLATLRPPTADRGVNKRKSAQRKEPRGA
jgi:hypothetical protein